jgi:hypothetical protein
MSGIRLSPKQRNEVIKSYVSGKTLASVGKEFDVCAMTVLNILREQDVRPRAAGVRALIVPELSPENAAYIAGIVDGEGCIYLHTGGFIGRRSYRPRWVVTITNTNKNLIDWLHDKIGTGNISLVSSNPLGVKPCYNYQIASQQNIVALLIQLLPYLKVKRERAEAAIRFYKVAEVRSAL